MTVTPGETPQGLLPQMMPPPYVNDKPPAYTDIYKQDPGAARGNMAPGVANVDPGMECVAAPPPQVPQLQAQAQAQPSALPPTPTTPPRTPEEEAIHATVTPGGSIAIV